MYVKYSNGWCDVGWNYQSRGFGYEHAMNKGDIFYANPELLASSVRNTYHLHFVPDNPAINATSDGGSSPRQIT